MKQLVFVSGKGGTGKTSLVAAMAQLFRPVVTADCDVDAANLALLLDGEDGAAQPFEAGQRAVLNPDLCTRCGVCAETCRFDAIELEADGTPQFDPIACEGCRACSMVCPTDAITFRTNQAGLLWVRETVEGVLVRAELGVAQDNSGKLVARVREVAREQATAHGGQLVLIDGPPGIGCPVHASLTGCDAAVVVVEPSAAAKHDLERFLDLVEHFRIPVWAVLNKHDLSPEGAAQIAALCERRDVPILARIPFDESVPQLVARGQSPLCASPEVARAVREASEQIAQRLELA